jgi:hypothetical protein
MQLLTWKEYYSKHKDNIKNVEEAYTHWVKLQNEVAKKLTDTKPKIKEKNNRNGN